MCSSRALLGRRAGDPRGAGKVREGDIQEISLTISIHILTSWPQLLHNIQINSKSICSAALAYNDIFLTSKLCPTSPSPRQGMLKVNWNGSRLQGWMCFSNFEFSSLSAALSEMPSQHAQRTWTWECWRLDCWLHCTALHWLLTAAQIAQLLLSGFCKAGAPTVILGQVFMWKLPSDQNVIVSWTIQYY